MTRCGSGGPLDLGGKRCVCRQPQPVRSLGIIWERPEPTTQQTHFQSGQTVTVLLSFPQEYDFNEHKGLMTALHPPCLGRPRAQHVVSLYGVSLAGARARSVWRPRGTGCVCRCQHGKQGPQLAYKALQAAINPLLDQVNTCLDQLEERNDHLSGRLQEGLTLAGRHILSSSRHSGRPQSIGSP